MKAPILRCAMLLTLSFGALSAVYGGSATWSANPGTNDWNTATNWMPPTIPNGSSETATFSATSKSTISIPTIAIELASVVFDAAASDYTIVIAANGYLHISGGGIFNNSGKLQKFVGRGDSSLDFEGGASAGSLTQFTIRGGGKFGCISRFLDHSSADHAAFIINGSEGQNGNGVVEFYGSATAANATFSVGAATRASRENAVMSFFGSSSGGNAVVTAEGSAVEGARGGSVTFWDISTAEQATLTANAGSNGGAGGEINFGGASQGAEARIEVLGNGTLNVWGREVTIGSLEGDGIVSLGRNQLTVGTNNLSTEFSGLIQDSGGLVKLGSGSLTLSGDNIYSGETTVSSGSLVINNTTGSGTGTGALQVNAGTLGGTGTIAGAVTVGTGSGAGAFLETSVGVVKPSSLNIQSALTFKADSTYTYNLNTNKAKADKVIANGVTIDSGAQFNFVAAANKTLNLGKVFVAISNTSATPISGTFSNLPEGATITAGANTYQASYEGGDGNDLTLTVVP